MGRDTDAIVYGVVEVLMRPQGKSIRLSTFRADGSSTSSTAWKVLSPGWHTVRAFWRSPGAVSLQVDAQPALEAFNAETGQTVHDVYLAFPGTEDDAVGSICIDALRLIDGGCDPAVVTGQPQSKTITGGSSTMLSVTAAGTGPLSYQWYAGTTAINGAMGSSVTVSPATTTSYFVRVTNGCGTSDSATATVTVCNPAAISTHPQSKTITSGTSTTLSATASGTAPLSYQWFVGTTAIDGATSNSVIVSPTATTTYFVRVTNGCGAVDSATATVTVVPEGASSLYVITPCRLLDTRHAAGPRGGPAIAGSQIRAVQVTGVCAIPPGAKAVVANVTAVTPTGQGFLVLYAAGTPFPGTSTMSYRPSKTRANNSIVALSPNGELNVYNDGSSSLHFIIDVTGYFQ